MMRKYLKYLAPALLILLLAGGYQAISQTFTRAVQLSQDTSGAFLVDSNNGFYVPAHLLFPANTNTPVPTVSSGATTPSITGTDSQGTITVNVAATTVTATFGRAFLSVPNCLVTANGTATTTISYTTATTSLAITASGAAGANNKYAYFCPSPS